MLSLILHLCWMCGWWSLTFVAIYKWRLLLYHLLCESFKYSFFFIKLFFLIWMLIQRHYIIENSPFDSRAQFSMSNQQYLYHHNKLLVFSAINSSHVLRMDFCMKNVWNDDFFCHSCSRNNSIDFFYLRIVICSSLYFGVALSLSIPLCIPLSSTNCFFCVRSNLAVDGANS